MTPRASGRQCGAKSPENAGHDIGPAVVCDRPCQGLDLGALAISPRLSRSHWTRDPVTATDPPAHRRPARHRAGNTRGQQTRCLEGTISVPVLSKHEIAGAIGVLGAAALQAGLSEGGGLLVSEDSGDRGAVEDPRAAPAIHPRSTSESRGPSPWHARARRTAARPRSASADPSECPLAFVTSVRCRPRPGPPVRFPHHPCVHRAEEQVTGVRPRPCPVHVVEQPADLGAGEAGSRAGGRSARHTAAALLAGEFVAQPLGAGVPPDDRVGDREPRRAIPHDRRLPLVGDPDRGDGRRVEVRLREAPR